MNATSTCQRPYRLRKVGGVEDRRFRHATLEGATAEARRLIETDQADAFVISMDVALIGRERAR